MAKKSIRQEWVIKQTDEYIGNIKPIYNNITKESMICSKCGEIYPYSDTHYVALIYSVNIINKYFPTPGYKARKGEEKRVLFKKEHVNKYIKLLKIKKNRTSMLKVANGPKKDT